MVIRRIARPLLSAAFIGQGVNSLLNPKAAAQAAAPTVDGLQSLPDPIGSSVPSDPQTVAQVNAVVQIGGGLLLASGKLPRIASAALAFTVLPANLGTHTFWNEPDPQLKAEKRQQFLTDLSLLGGLLIASADTAGKPSLGWRGRRAAERLSERVSSALPGSDDPDFAELSEKIAHGLQLGAERGSELASTAAERGAPYAEAALERGRELADVAAERSAPLAKKARKRGQELASTAAERSAPYAEAALERGRELAGVAAERGRELADVAAERSGPLAKEARKRGEKLAETARVRGLELAESAREHGSEWADVARERGGEWADTARERVGAQTKRRKRFPW